MNTITTKDGTGAIPPLMLKTPANPGGTPIEAFDQIRAGVRGPVAVLQGSHPPVLRLQPTRRESLRRSAGVVPLGLMAGMPASYFCIKAFSETDLTEDLKKSTCRPWFCTASPARMASPPRRRPRKARFT